MSCGEVLPALGARAPPAVPVELAMRLCLRRRPGCREEPRGGRQPLRPCLHQQHERHEQHERRAKEKRVVFADTKGLALTAVRFFSKIEEELGALRHVLAALRPRAPPPPGAYVLDFPPPPAALPLRALVCLESCAVHERALTGTVRVRNIGYEKQVLVRVTCDGWRSFRDVACRYVPGAAAAGTDAFSFELALPKAPGGAVEFCVSFRCGQATHWDNNQGRNYRVRAAAPGLVLPQRRRSVGPYW